MFDLLKMAGKIQGQVKEIKSELEKARFSSDVDGVKCVVSGDLELKEFSISPELLQKMPSEVENRVSRAVQDAFGDAKKEALSKFKKLTGGFPVPGF